MVDTLIVDQRAVPVLVVEDQEGVGELAVAWVESQRTEVGSQRFRVAGFGRTTDEARRLIRELEFDLVILDLELEVPRYPVGFELAELIHECRPGANIVLWTNHISVEGDLLRRACRPFGSGALVQAIAPKKQPLAMLARAVENALDLDNFLWIERGLRPPHGYSAVLDFTRREDDFIRDFAQFGGKPAEIRGRQPQGEGAFSELRLRVKRKVMREMAERGEQLPATDKAISDEQLRSWARKRHLHWPLTESELKRRAVSPGQRPNR